MPIDRQIVNEKRDSLEGKDRGKKRMKRNKRHALYLIDIYIDDSYERKRAYAYKNMHDQQRTKSTGISSFFFDFTLNHKSQSYRS